MHDLFIARNLGTSGEPDVELETQREVVMNMLSRIVQHHEVSLQTKFVALCLSFWQCETGSVFAYNSSADFSQLIAKVD